MKTNNENDWDTLLKSELSKLKTAVSYIEDTKDALSISENQRNELIDKYNKITASRDEIKDYVNQIHDHLRTRIETFESNISQLNRENNQLFIHYASTENSLNQQKIWVMKKILNTKLLAYLSLIIAISALVLQFISK